MMLKIYKENPHERVITQAANLLQNGGVMIYPTDTTYGLGADIFNKKAIERILQIKHLSKNKNLSFICDDFKHMHEFVHISNFAFKIMKRCLPGPYTFILEATKIVPKLMISKQKTAGIRLPDDEFCMRLVKKIGHPIVSTSLPSPDDFVHNDPEEIFKDFNKQVDLIIECGFLQNLPSTVVDLQNDQLTIIREGSGDLQKLYG